MSEHEKHCKAKLMSEILYFRYEDLEKERQLCLELLTWAEGKKDLYGKAFAYTYLGDYYIAKNLVVKAKEYFEAAEEALAAFCGICEELYLRIYSLVALYYKLIADEQSSVQYYMMALYKARFVGDTDSESIILNNLGTAFLRHKSFDESRRYLEEACRLQTPSKAHIICTVILSNLMEVLLKSGETEEARKRIEECDKVLEHFPDIKEEGSNRNWCCYYAAVKNEEKAISSAKRILELVDTKENIFLNTFEDYSMLFQSMYELGSQLYAKRFLELMEKTKTDEALEQPWIFEECSIMYCLRFEPEKQHEQAYRNLYYKSHEMKHITSKNIVSALKSKITLAGVLSQKKQLQAESEYLKRQASIDELTQVLNRRYFMQLMRERAISYQGSTLGIIMFDVDYFKEYNDHYGHPDGDRALQNVGACIWKHKNEDMYPCRYGGDEFACICDNMEEQEMEAYIMAVRNELSALNIAHEKSRCSDRITLSAGYSIGQEGFAPYLILQLADLALYESKLSGRNAYKAKQAGK